MKKKHIVIGTAVLVILAAAAVSYLLFAEGSGRKVLASVNGERITAGRFLQEVAKLEEPTRSMINEDPSQYLDMMIIRALVLQEARKAGLQAGKDKGEEDLIQEFLQKKFAAPPPVSREEVADVYRVYKDGFAGKELEEVAPMIEQAIQQQKQEREYMEYLQGIRQSAAVEIHLERLKAVTVKPADSATNSGEDLARALRSGKPVLVDFGSNSCIPCRQLRPVLKEIKKEQEGKLEVLVIDVNQHQNLAGEYRIQVIPTLVFFDSSGKEMFRHQGFRPKAALMEELKKIGVG